MRKSELVHLLNNIGLKPSRKLGQNFLIDSNTIHLFSKFIGPKLGESIIEIGAGFGNLTDFLAISQVNLTLIEYDVRLARFLQKKYLHQKNVRVIQADAARIDYDNLTAQSAFKCVGNLPYSSSSVILAKFLEIRNKPKEMYFLVQREMAERLKASPASKGYNALSIRIQTLYEIKFLKAVSPNVFWPIPEVDSIFISLKLRTDIPSFNDFQNLSKIAKLSFAQRRKLLVSNLQKSYQKEKVIQALKKIGVDSLVRAESLSPEQFLLFVNYLQ